MLERRLLDEGYKVKLFDFPQYDQPFGEMVGRYLTGEFGDIHEVPVEVPITIFAADRYSVSDELWEAKNEDDLIIILNRYSDSNKGFQGGKFKGAKRQEVIDYINEVESRLPPADKIIYLHVPTSYTEKMLLEKDERDYLNGEEKDIHERDSEYQNQVEETYLELAANDERWSVINCVVDGVLLSKEEIHELIWKEVEPVLP